MKADTTPDEGYIKFQPIWQQQPAFPAAELSNLLHWRQACYQRQWIGAYPDGIGFGNISERCFANPEHFYITGSATGGLIELNPEQVAKVTATDAAHNKLWCEGPILASSESMSHAAIYQELPWVQAVIHIHELTFWERLLHQVPTTDADAPYGSPEMVSSIIDLLRTTDLPQQQIFVMEGHVEGIFAFGEDLAAAFRVLDNYTSEILKL
jgi:ribulose-5-phosphate 4-epimerase/fuculose-1-phosphate aldolase